MARNYFIEFPEPERPAYLHFRTTVAYCRRDEKVIAGRVLLTTHPDTGELRYQAQLWEGVRTRKRFETLGAEATLYTFTPEGYAAAVKEARRELLYVVRTEVTGTA